ncbi:MAG: hypothetical protein N3C57_06630 [Aquificaceae bacterium]|nr:hypothetical protein [Aquificaceae bacterium]
MHAIEVSFSKCSKHTKKLVAWLYGQKPPVKRPERPNDRYLRVRSRHRIYSTELGDAFKAKFFMFSHVFCRIIVLCPIRVSASSITSPHPLLTAYPHNLSI